jgi:segregation and condensation protein A
MSAEPFQGALDFEAADSAAEVGEALVLDLDGFEGPLHVLLALARQQKVDLLRFSVSALADQYLAFVKAARQSQFALAADYLVMAAWLTYLKSRLLLPKPEKTKDDEPPAEDLAAALAFRLAKLDAMRKAMEALKALPQTGRDLFTRGDPDAIRVHSTSRLDVDLYALIGAYAQGRSEQTRREYRPTARIDAYPLEVARDRLRALSPTLSQWTSLRGLAPQPDRARADGSGPSRASYMASTFSAGLELVKEGDLEVRQLEAFADLYLRAKAPDLIEAPTT